MYANIMLIQRAMPSHFNCLKPLIKRRVPDRELIFGYFCFVFVKIRLDVRSVADVRVRDVAGGGNQEKVTVAILRSNNLWKSENFSVCMARCDYFNVTFINMINCLAFVPRFA